MSVIQFIALIKDEQSTETAWPAMKETHPYWQEATKHAAHTAHTLPQKGILDNVFSFCYSNYYCDQKLQIRL